MDGIWQLRIANEIIKVKADDYVAGMLLASIAMSATMSLKSRGKNHK